jgi:uncharacterized protein YpbB
MYNASYQEISAETLKWLLAGEPADRQEVIMREINLSKENKIRNFKIEFANGDYYQLENGIVTGSKTTSRK